MVNDSLGPHNGSRLEKVQRGGGGGGGDDEECLFSGPV